MTHGHCILAHGFVSGPDATKVTALAEVDPRKVRVVEMRFFAGLSVEEVADVLKVSKETVMRDWRLAKVWLLRELEGEAVAREN